MVTIKDAIAYLLMLIDVGSVLRLSYCLIRIIFNPDELTSYKKKMINLCIYIVLATCIMGLAFDIKSYVT